MGAQVLLRFCTGRQGVVSSPGSALMDMSPGCNPLFPLLLLGAPSSSKGSSLIGAALCRAALVERLIFGLLQPAVHSHITQPGPSERSRAPLSLQSSLSCLHHFLFTVRSLSPPPRPLYRAERCVLGKWPRMNFNFCANTEGDDLCIERLSWGFFSFFRM